MKGRFSKKNNFGFLDPDEILADSASVLGSIVSSEGKLERPIEKIFSTVFLLLIGFGFLYLTARAASLQIQEGENNFTRSQENRFLVRPVFPPRGIIFDNVGQPLVENYPCFGIGFEKEEFLKGNKELPLLLSNLERILGKPREFFYSLGFPTNDDSDRLPLRITVAKGIKPEEILSLAPELYHLSGVQIFEEFRRVYKNSYGFAHLLGFVGKVSEEDMLRNARLLAQDTIGKSGIERAYDEVLRGKMGRK